jgi:diacylglycerol kinase family enzyme
MRLTGYPSAAAVCATSTVSVRSSPVKIELIVNPYAAGHDRRRLAGVADVLRGAGDLEVASTRRGGHGLPLAQSAVTRGVDCVVAWGGDGTVNEVANALVGTSVPLAVLPGGSTNVTARSLGMPSEPVAAARRVVDGLRLGRTRRIGLGRCDDRYFTFASGCGMDAEIVKAIERRGEAKRRFGAVVYVPAGFASWGAMDRSDAPMRVRFDDGTESPPLATIVVQNTRKYTFFGPTSLSLAVGAGFEDPLVCFGVRSLRFLPTLLAIGAAFWSPSLVARFPQVYQRPFHAATVHGDRPFEVQCDGEYRGAHEVVDYRWEPDALDVIC